MEKRPVPISILHTSYATLLILYNTSYFHNLLFPLVLLHLNELQSVYFLNLVFQQYYEIDQINTLFIEIINNKICF